jgi:inosine/xanthosine triphosphate pyrophosphatase family protein
MIFVSKSKYKGAIPLRVASAVCAGLTWSPGILFVMKNEVPERQAAQLEDEQKNQVSHRGSAIRTLKPLLRKLLAD